MEEEDRCLAPGIHEQLVAALDEMAETLRSTRELAESRRGFEDWWSLVQRMLALRGQLQVGPLGSNFEEDMQDLCNAYDNFVRAVPGALSHKGKPAAS